METFGLISFLILWGLVIIRQGWIVLGHFGKDVPAFSNDSIFRGTWLFRPREGRRSRSVIADMIILAAYLLIEIVVVVFLVTQ